MISLQDALAINAGAADDEPATGVSVGDIRAWRKLEKQLLVGTVTNAIKLSESNISVSEQAEKISRLSEDVVTLNSIARRAEAALREAAEL